ncbi:MAG: phosphate butyryltransferase [Clostridioides sp.]|jgi:phosphate butyryltransferase|nr:phosphate butyryltransferase [Clostridioides sp.]
MLIKSIGEILQKSIELGKVKIAIAKADDEEIKLVKLAMEKNLADFILIGDKKKIKKSLEENNVEFDENNIIDECDSAKAGSLAVELVNKKQVDIPMKGLMHTSDFVRAVLNKENGLRTNKRLSQITIFDGISDSIQFLTDCAINIKPDLKCKVEIINNCVEAARYFGYSNPKVALIGAVETVNESMPDSIESAVLTQMNRRGQIKDCVVDGPLSLDNAISEESARIKGIESSVAGRADILVASDLVVSNTFSKALHYYANKETASIIMGTKSPIIMTSRTDDMKNKLNTIATIAYIYHMSK